MKLFLVVDETPFFHPDFVAEFLRRTKDDVVGAALVTKIGPKSNINTWLMRHWYYLRPQEMLRLAYRKCLSALKDQKRLKRKEDAFQSVRSVLKTFDIPYICVETSINKPEYIERIRRSQPDVVVSSCSMIFGEELLKLPALYCINRHSALLPSYGGMWPVFQAYRSGEPFTGVTIHTMEKKIDRGTILAQRKVAITGRESLYELYDHCFKLSVEALLEALERLRGRTSLNSSSNDEGVHSYYSFPTPQEWKEFRRRGGRFV